MGCALRLNINYPEFRRYHHNSLFLRQMLDDFDQIKGSLFRNESTYLKMSRCGDLDLMFKVTVIQSLKIRVTISTARYFSKNWKLLAK